MLALVLAALLQAAPPAADGPPPGIAPAEAPRHLEELVVVEGTVAQVSVSASETTFLNFGGRYPNQVFSAVVFKSKRALFPNLESCEGKTVQVQGIVRLYFEKPEIVLSEPGQLRAASCGPPPPSRSAPPRDLGGLYFDPLGADFTAWIQRFKDEVYRNWIVPPAALRGEARGHADFEFKVERDGSMSSLRLEKSSGTPSLDQAAEEALKKSRCLPLPDDYRAPRVTMKVTLVYDEPRK